MSQAQFSLACKDLNIDRNDKNMDSFFLAFYNYDEDCFCARRISLVGVLLGNSNIEEKIHLLFQIYDTDSSKTLRMSEIKLMLNDILTISLKSLPNFARFCNSGANSDAIDDYKNELISMKGSFVKYYLDIFFEESHSDIHYNKFFELFNNKDIWILTSPTALRNHCKVLLNDVKDKATIIEELLSHPEKLNPELMRRLELSIPSRKINMA